MYFACRECVNQLVSLAFFLLYLSFPIMIGKEEYTCLITSGVMITSPPGENQQSWFVAFAGLWVEYRYHG